eukprot:CAMPEP_0184346378 /NCGR_PEP_ID=MMETSP1089-20130417/14657_1 /TAXON_ID=38269 ORGANISM="Gloeochaete wittrockiana, Strain SAG46.84" /NCGR_SAMPLE_ID=MMETSP1089 /ASSEMBLY_ACC=CAM_ASM_000445 /LENGTH=327 /DNA_ID=CAMNT_0026677041 /DNA_START=6 /DNA_END=989 /DNA_ORIENTATION=-
MPSDQEDIFHFVLPVVVIVRTPLCSSRRLFDWRHRRKIVMPVNDRNFHFEKQRRLWHFRTQFQVLGRGAILRVDCQVEDDGKKRLRKSAKRREAQREEGIGGFFVPGVNGFRLRVGAGSICLVLVALNRMFLTTAESATPNQFFSETITVVASALLLTVGFFLRTTSGESLSVSVAPEPRSAQVFELANDLTPALKEELAWASYALLTQTYASSVLVVRVCSGQSQLEVLLRRGEADSSVLDAQYTNLAHTALNTGEPARIRTNSMTGLQGSQSDEEQDIIVLAVGETAALVLVSARSSSFSEKSIRWSASLASKLGAFLTDRDSPS